MPEALMPKKRKEKKPEKIPVSVSLSGSLSKDNVFYSGLRPNHQSKFCANLFSSFLCYPAEKAANKKLRKMSIKTS